MSKAVSDLPRHRGGKCSKCDGAGVDIYGCDADDHDDLVEGGGDCPGCPECEACEGKGDILWEWHPDESDGYCTDCKTEGLDVMGTGEDGEEGAVCLPCHLRWHATQCGCDKWPKEVLLTPDQQRRREQLVRASRESGSGGQGR